MNTTQIILFLLIGAVLALLLWGRYRYDLVAFGALVVALIVGVVPQEEAFSGLGHPATVIIALVLIVSRGLSNSGAIELLSRRVLAQGRGLASHVGTMAGVGAALSAVMNNVAALALLMPVDLQAAAKAKRSPALSLMPLSFATILGGMVTLIGTPPNIVIATFRGETLGEPYAMFDFAPVGLAVAIVGVAYVALVGWRLLPAPRVCAGGNTDAQEFEDYISEAKPREDSSAIGSPLRDLLPVADEHDVSILGLVRQGHRLPGSAWAETIRKSDLIVLEGGAKAIEGFLGAAGFQHASAKVHGGLLGEGLKLMEVVVPVGARIVGRSAMGVRLSARQGVLLLGVSRQGRRFRERVRKLTIRAGDVLLLAGPEQRLPEVASWLGCLPLAKRGLQVRQRRKAGLAIGLFVAAILAASFGWLGLPVALAAVAVLYVLTAIVPLSDLYESVEWPVIVLLGSLIPIGAALEASGGTALIAQTVVAWSGGLPTWMVLLILMVVAMTLSDVINNVATALITAPIAVDVAHALEVSPDPFLMGVAVASSCAFLTPIGHKNNTIIMGPGGYAFGDYWRVGLPLEVIVLVIALPSILLFWPLVEASGC
jgi:di/tricarboxylate transporter